MNVKKGDEVKIVSGEYAGKTGKVSGVNTKDVTVFVDGVTLKRTIGTEKQVPMRPSKMIITSLDLADNARQRILLRKVKEVKIEKKPEAAPAPKVEAKAEAKAETETKAEEHKHDDHDHSSNDAGHKEHVKNTAPRTKSAVAKSKVAATATGRR